MTLLLIDARRPSATDCSIQSKMDPPCYPIARVLTRSPTRTGTLTGVKPAPGRPSPGARLTSLTSRTGRELGEPLGTSSSATGHAQSDECRSTAKHHRVRVRHTRDAKRPLGSASVSAHAARRWRAGFFATARDRFTIAARGTWASPSGKRLHSWTLRSRCKARIAPRNLAGSHPRRSVRHQLHPRMESVETDLAPLEYTDQAEHHRRMVCVTNQQGVHFP